METGPPADDGLPTASPHLTYLPSPGTCPSLVTSFITPSIHPVTRNNIPTRHLHIWSQPLINGDRALTSIRHPLLPNLHISDVSHTHTHTHITPPLALHLPFPAPPCLLHPSSLASHRTLSPSFSDPPSLPIFFRVQCITAGRSIYPNNRRNVNWGNQEPWPPELESVSHMAHDTRLVSGKSYPRLHSQATGPDAQDPNYYLGFDT